MLGPGRPPGCHPRRPGRPGGSGGGVVAGRHVAVVRDAPHSSHDGGGGDGRVRDGVEYVLGLDVQLLLGLAGGAGEQVLPAALVVGHEVLEWKYRLSGTRNLYL